MEMMMLQISMFYFARVWGLLFRGFRVTVQVLVA